MYKTKNILAFLYYDGSYARSSVIVLATVVVGCVHKRSLLASRLTKSGW